MVKIQLPYGRGQIETEAPSSARTQMLTTHLSPFKPEYNGAYLAQQALEHLIGMERLCERVRDAKRVVILSNNHTHPVPSRILMPLLLQEIHMGSPEADITILVATGHHRAPTREKLLERCDEAVVAKGKVGIYNCDGENLVDAGELPSENRLWLNRAAAQAGVLVGEGFIEPRFFAGFSGGRKNVLPGVCRRAMIMYNHCARNIDSSESTVDVLEISRIHLDMVSAVGKTGLNFTLNIVINKKKEIVAAIAGRPSKAREEGCGFLENLCGYRAGKVDIVVASNGGYPLDQNIYQSIKGMTTASWPCKIGGIIVVAAEYADGHGGEQFHDTFAKGKDAGSILQEILARDKHGTQPDQWQSQISTRVLIKNRVIFVSSQPKELIEGFGMRWAPSLPAAMELAVEMGGVGTPSILVPPDAVFVIAIPAEEE